MKQYARLFMGVVVAASVLFSFGTSAATLADGDALTIARTVEAKWVHAVASKDADGLADLFTADGVLQNPVGVFKGKAAIRDFQADGFKSGIVNETSEVTDARRIGDVIYYMGDFTILRTSGTGTKETRGRFACVLLKSGSDWRLSMVTGFALPPSKPK